MAALLALRTIMPVFSLRQAPSLRWMPRTAGPRGVRLPRHGGDAAPLDPALPAREAGVRVTRCGIELPDAYALRLEARTHATPRNPPGCPLEASVLRQWCVRSQCGACPEQGEPATPALLQTLA